MKSRPRNCMKKYKRKNRKWEEKKIENRPDIRRAEQHTYAQHIALCIVAGHVIRSLKNMQIFAHEKKHRDSNAHTHTHTNTTTKANHTTIVHLQYNTFYSPRLSSYVYSILYTVHCIYGYTCSSYNILFNQTQPAMARRGGRPVAHLLRIIASAVWSYGHNMCLYTYEDTRTHILAHRHILVKSAYSFVRSFGRSRARQRVKM